MRHSVVLCLSCLLLALNTGLSDAATNPAPTPPDECQAGLNSYKSKNYSAAVDQFSICLEFNLPSDVRVYVLQKRAQSFRGLNNFKSAVQDQKNSLELKAPEDVWPHIHLAVYYRELKQYDLALAALKEATKYDEDGPGSGPGMAVYYHTGWTLHEAGRYREAIEAYTLGIPKQTDFGVALYRRALSYEAVGDRKRAKQDLAGAAKLAPSEGYGAEITAKLMEYGFSVKSRAPK